MTNSPNCNPPPSLSDSFPVPIMDGAGLYGGGSNTPPPFHRDAGILAASLVPSSGAVLVGMGHSITKSHFDAWMGLGQTDAVMIPGTCAGCTEHNFDQFADKGWVRVFFALDSAGYAPSDVDVVWFSITKSHTHSTRTLEYEPILARIREAFPNVRQVLVANRPYGGYRTNASAEPEAWMEGPSLRSFVLRHLGETDPWVGWSADLWANGAAPRSDGFAWLRSDFARDGLHYSPAGSARAAGLTHDAFGTSPFTGWYQP